MCNMIALSLLVQKLWPRSSFYLKVGQNVKVKVTQSNFFVQTEKVLPQGYPCVI